MPSKGRSFGGVHRLRLAVVPLLAIVGSLAAWQARRSPATTPTPERAAGETFAAGLIRRGIRDGAPQRVAQGLELLTRQPAEQRSDESRFQEAVALDALGLGEHATVAYERYLQRNESGERALEARRRLADLRAQLAGPADDEAQRYERKVLEELLPAWAAAWQQRRPGDAVAALAKAREAAVAYEGRYRDPLLRTLVGAVDGAGPEAAALARAHVALAGARRAYAGQDLQRCRAEARRARAELLAGGALLAPLARLTSASCAYLAGDLDASRDEAEAAAADAALPQPPSPLLASQIDWLRGLVAHAMARPLASLGFYERALAGFHAAGDASRAARVRTLLADLDEYLGRTDAAWQETTASLRGRLDAGRRYQALCALARLSADAGYLEVARWAAAAAAAAAERAGAAEYVADAAMVQARIEAEDGDRARSIATWRRALVLAEGIPQRERSTHLLAYARVELAAALVATDPGAAEDLLAGVALQGTGELAIAAAMVRADVAEGRGDWSTVETVLRQAIERSSAERQELPQLRDRDLFFARREELHLRLVRLLADRGEDESALAVLEDWRSESLAGSVEAAAALPSEDLADRLGAEPGRAFYSLLALPDEMLVWRRTPAGAVLVRHRLSRVELQELVAGAVVEMRRRGGGDSARRLARLVFGDELPAGVERLVIAPDAALFAVPFAALPAPGGDAPIVAAHQVELTPGLRSWLALRERAAMPMGCALLVEGAPDGGALDPRLARLRGLDEELRGLAAKHACSLFARSVPELHAQLERSPALLHYAGHTLESGPAGGALLLAGGKDVVPLESAEIESWRLQGPLVVLSTCSAAEGRPSPLAGRDGLARAFLAAGARSVVANLWPVSDDSARELSTILHARLAAGDSAGRALLAAQRELLAKGRPVASWGGWVLIGAG